MANDGPAHFLSLKVMRVSVRTSSSLRVALAIEYFLATRAGQCMAAFLLELTIVLGTISCHTAPVSGLTVLKAHSSAHILSLQGAKPLPGHPKTLRDLTHASELLTLPSAFGSIQLGETFSSCLCVNNESQSSIEVVQVRVEMQTAAAKMTLSEMDNDAKVVTAGDTLQSVVHHEIKELGQHVLACTVTYRLPPNARPILGAGEDAGDPTLVTFRKFYKFAVTNPLSVKTKVHAPRSPTALLTLGERDKVFLEVHIQNLTQEPIYFERMLFEPIDGWEAADVNCNDDNTSIFSGALAIMQPQDTRQYLFILSPRSSSLVPPILTPGSIIPLGRLDISWRSPFGEPGRLLTSMLTRKIPFPAVQPPASALPPHLKRTIGAGSISRPHTPQASRPTSPPPNQRPGSPFQVRAGSISQIALPQSVAQTPPIQQHSDLDVNLVVTHLPRTEVRVEKPFTITFRLVVSSEMPLRDFAMRKLAFAVQHLQVPRASPSAASIPPVTSLPGAFGPRLPSSGFSTPTSAAGAFNYALAHQKILDAALRPVDGSLEDTIHVPLAEEPHTFDPIVPILPPPYFEGRDEAKVTTLGDVLPMGSSATFLPPVQISTGDFGTPSNPIMQEFHLTFVPTKPGFCRIGGLRVLLVHDRGTSDYQEFEVEQTSQTRVQALKEYHVIAETWVST